MEREVAARLKSIADDLHAAANPPFRAGVGDLKREIRAARDAIRQLIEEFTT